MPTNETDLSYLLENLMVNNTDVIYFKDLQSRFIKVNEACVHKHGWKSAETCLGKTDFDFYAREHAEKAFADEQRIIQTGEPLRGIEEKETWPDGRVTWASTTKMALRDTSGTIIGTFGVTRDITEHKKSELSAQHYAAQIRRIKEEMEEDLRMAGELQKSFIPEGYPVFPEGVDPDESCVEFRHSHTPCGQVTGDYCSITRLSASEVAVFLCDVKGTGIRSALAIGLIRGIMQEIAGQANNPGFYLEKMNEALFPLLRQTAELDATACQMVLDVSTGKLRFASAGHPMPIYFRDGKGARWLCQDPEAYGPALSRVTNASYSTTEFQLQPDDAIIMFTDGLFSVPNNLGHAFGLKRLLDSAHSLVGDPLEDIFQGLEGDALAFSKERKFIDDVCLVGFHLKSLLDPCSAD